MRKQVRRRMENNKNNSGAALAKKMAVSLVCGLVAGFAFMMLREKLNASGNSALWKTINDLLFQDIRGSRAGVWHLLYHRAAVHQGAAAGHHPDGVHLHLAGHWQHLGYPYHGTDCFQDPFLVPAEFFSGTAAGRRCGLYHVLHGPVQCTHRGPGRGFRFYRLQPSECGAEHHSFQHHHGLW